ncbi:MAG: aminopeptidase [Ignavibacteria bacterium]
MEELRKAARTALLDFMGLKSDETMLVITDSAKREIGYAIFEEGKILCKEALLVEIKSRERNGEEPPQQVAELMKNVDVVLCPTLKSLTHTEARREAVKYGVRVGTMPGISKETMIRCLNVDSERIVQLTAKVATALKGVKTITVKTKAGTDISLPVEGRDIFESTGVLKNKGQSGNIPSGEVYLAPLENKSNGTIVIDGSMASIGLLKTPLVIKVINGFAEQISGGDEAEKLIELFEKAGREARAVAEFGIGTNYKAQLCGDILEDEKVLGTIHIAFGNNKSMGGTIAVSSHLDGLVKKPNVYFDEKLIMKEGTLLLD